MYKFYYEYLKPTYVARCRLLFTDTDSLCCQIETADIYEDMAQNIYHFDTSNFDPSHPFFSQKPPCPWQNKIRNRFCTPLKIRWLSSKNVQSEMRQKILHKSQGHPETLRQKARPPRMFPRNPQNTIKTTTAKFRTFQSSNHIVRTVKISNSVSLPWTTSATY